ncbi:MAG: amidohydrolase family protein, partial [Acidimicrobiia bacterium]
RILLVLALLSGCTPAETADTSDSVVAAGTSAGGPSAPVNLAKTATVSSSSELAEQPVSMVNDGISDVAAGNFWGAGDFAPQWIEFDLSTASTIERIALTVSQSPNGPTVHHVLGRAGTDDPWTTLSTLDGETSDSDRVVVEPSVPWESVGFVRVETLRSPSWVSWGEIEIWGSPGEASPLTGSTLVEDLPEGGPDLILYGGTVITVDEGFEVDEALAVDDGLITAVGSDEEIVALAGQSTHLVDLDGATVLPGIVDPHVHMIQHQSPDLDAMSAAEAELIVSGRTTVGIPGIDVTHDEGFREFSDRAVMRLRLYARYNTNCGEPPPDPDFWRSRDFGLDPGPRVAYAGVKVFADGGSCNGPAVTWEYPDRFPDGIPFTDWVGSGSLYVTAEELAGVIVETTLRGGQTVVHVAGDRAVVIGLNGMELALDDSGNPNRHRLDHNDFVPPDQRSRYSELGVIPVVFGDYDACFAGDGMWSFIAPVEALEYHRANRSMIEANSGLPVAWHSDLPYTALDIFAQLQFLVTVAEVTDDGTECAPPPFLEDQGVSVEQAIRMMTWNAAYAMRLEGSIGSLETGKIADMIIVESNPLTQPAEDVYQNRLLATLIDGVSVHCAGSTVFCSRLP